MSERATTTEPQYVAKTLAWCNDRRKEQGRRSLKRLPKGEQSEPLSCPCGAATGLWVDTFHYGPDELGAHIALPTAVKRFVRAFDAGRLPQYEMRQRGGSSEQATFDQFAYIRRHYGVRPEVGMRVVAAGRHGTIDGADGQYLRIVLDEDGFPSGWHPTWCIEYPADAHTATQDQSSADQAQRSGASPKDSL